MDMMPQAGSHKQMKPRSQVKQSTSLETMAEGGWAMETVLHGSQHREAGASRIWATGKLKGDAPGGVGMLLKVRRTQQSFGRSD
jgi:hypothetical protein